MNAGATMDVGAIMDAMDAGVMVDAMDTGAIVDTRGFPLLCLPLPFGSKTVNAITI